MIRGSVDRTGQITVSWNPSHGVILPAPPVNGVPHHWIPCACCGEMQAVPVACVSIMCSPGCWEEAREAQEGGDWENHGSACECDRCLSDEDYADLMRHEAIERN